MYPEADGYPYPRTGWGVRLRPLQKQILKVLESLTEDGLWINHKTWIADTDDAAHAVGTWKRYEGPSIRYAWEIYLYSPYPENDTCYISIYKNGDKYHNAGGPLLKYLVNKTQVECLFDNRLDALLDD